MKTSTVGRQLIEKYEGLILKAYDDANDHIVKPGDEVRGVLTIGYGHTSAAGLPKVTVGQSITRAEADQILANDLSKVEADVTRLVKVSLNQNQFDALVSFQFNTGALAKSSALKYLNTGDYTTAADRLTLYNKAPQISSGPIKGLVARRAEEKVLFLKPVPVPHAPLGGVVLTGTAAIATTPHHYWPYIIVGTIVVAAIAWFVVHRHNKIQEAKAIPNVN